MAASAGTATVVAVLRLTNSPLATNSKGARTSGLLLPKRKGDVMNYATSDLHGERAKFEKLLRLINFASTDNLLIAGDIIDRGDDSIRLLLNIMEMQDNVRVCLGNHEQMMLRALHEGGWRADVWRTGFSQKTALDFFNLTGNLQQQIVDYLSALPLSIDISCEGVNFHMVHGWPIEEDDHAKLWGRPTKYSRNPLHDSKLLVGHTPVPLILFRDTFQQNTYFEQLEQKNEHIKIFHGRGGWYGLDTANTYPVPGSCLSCLRLDDLKEFYIL